MLLITPAKAYAQAGMEKPDFEARGREASIITTLTLSLTSCVAAHTLIIVPGSAHNLADFRFVLTVLRDMVLSTRVFVKIMILMAASPQFSLQLPGLWIRDVRTHLVV